MSKKEKPEMTEAEEDELRKNPINVYQCAHPDCQKLDAMSYAAFKNHVADVHGLSADQLKGTRKMMMHMDGAQWFSSTYEWVLESGLKFHQFCKNARAKDDMMRYECYPPPVCRVRR